MLKVNPLPRGFLPEIRPPKAKGFLYPAEEASLLGCTKVGAEGSAVVPLWRPVS